MRATSFSPHYSVRRFSNDIHCKTSMLRRIFASINLRLLFGDALNKSPHSFGCYAPGRADGHSHPQPRIRCDVLLQFVFFFSSVNFKLGRSSAGHLVLVIRPSSAKANATGASGENEREGKAKERAEGQTCKKASRGDPEDALWKRKTRVILCWGGGDEAGKSCKG